MRTGFIFKILLKFIS